MFRQSEDSGSALFDGPVGHCQMSQIRLHGNQELADRRQLRKSLTGLDAAEVGGRDAGKLCYSRLRKPSVFPKPNQGRS